MRSVIILFAFTIGMLTWTHASQFNLQPFPQDGQVSQQAEVQDENLANWALGLGIASLAGPPLVIWLALACFGTCAPIVLIWPSLLVLGIGIASTIVGFKALKRLRASGASRGKGKAIFGIVAGLLGGAAGLYFSINAIFNV
jgi:hypothetical protein